MKIRMETIAEIPDDQLDLYLNQLIRDVGVPKEVVEKLRRDRFSIWESFYSYPKPNRRTTRYWIES